MGGMGGGGGEEHLEEGDETLEWPFLGQLLLVECVECELVRLHKHI